MKTISIILVVIAAVVGFWYFKIQGGQPLAIGTPNLSLPFKGTPSSQEQVKDREVVAFGLDTPWGMVFLPNGELLVTERKGTVRLIKDGKLVSDPVATLSSVREIGEGGLLGITIHPDFSTNNFVYFYYTYSESSGNTLNRVVRMTYKDSQLTNENVVLDKIPGASNHDGGRIKFGPDRFLYIGTGDAQEPSRSQDTNSLAGKILRITDEGKSAPGNPFGNEVYSLGHRNVQGLTWDTEGRLLATEHGRSGAQSGFDELNLIESGKNYGWPDIEGDKTKSGMERPIRHSGSTNTWAPSGVAFFSSALYFGGLRGQALYKATLSGSQVVGLEELFKSEYGRIRDVILGPDNMIYFSTSNQDGRGSPIKDDDRIIRVKV